jgi:hypothetical protein
MHEQGYPKKYNPKNACKTHVGLGSLVFGGLVALVTAVIIVVSVGGGLGETLASCRNKRLEWVDCRTGLFERFGDMVCRSDSLNESTFPTSVSSPTSTAVSSALSPSSTSSTGFDRLVANHSTAPYDSVESAYLDRPGLTGVIYTTHFEQTYTLTCGVNFTGSLPADGGGVIADVAGVITYSPK